MQQKVHTNKSKGDIKMIKANKEITPLKNMI